MDTHALDRRHLRYRVEPLRLADISQIANLEKRVFLEPLSEAEVWRKILFSRARYVVVKDGRTIAAYFGFEVLGPYAHVLANVTHPDYRRQGLAQLVLTQAYPWAKKLGVRAFVGEVRSSNLPQFAVLQSIAWTQVQVIPHFFANGEDAHVVMKILD